MSHVVEVTVVSDNHAARGDVHAEHGLSFWIDTGTHRVLFDTGRGRALPHNLRELDLDVARLDAVAISHGHRDHTGALPYLLPQVPETARIHLHPQALEPRCVRDPDGHVRSIGMETAAREAVESRGDRVALATGPTEVVPGVTWLGRIPRGDTGEDAGGDFFRDEACTQTDPIDDDTALLLDTPSGAVVLLGCAHAGVVNTLDHATSRLGSRRVHAVIGGMHLKRASTSRLEVTARTLEALEVAVVAPMHCTGDAATAWLAARLPGRCTTAAAGSRFRFGD